MLQRIVTLPVPAEQAARRAQRILVTRQGEGEVPAKSIGKAKVRF